MMGPTIGKALILIINSLGGLYILAVLLRFLLQAVKADFYNPASQAIVKITTPLLKPFRKVIPGFRGLDFAALFLALALNTAATSMMIFVGGYTLPGIGIIVSWALVGLLAFILNIYYYSLMISVIASFIAPFSGNPILLVIYQILEPINSRVRRIIPPMGGLDLSPLFIFLGINVLEILLVNSIAQGLNLRPDLVIGI
jgi:YggT family protein